VTRRCAPVRRTPLSARSPPAPMRCRNPSPARISRYVCAWPNCCLTCADLPPLRAPLAAHRITPSGYSGVPVGLFSDSAPTHLRCAGVPLGLFGKPKRSSFSRVRGLHQATPCSFLQNARPPAASRPPVGGGSFAPPCAPLSRPRAAGFFYPDKRWLCAGGRTERQRGWLPAQFLSLEGKRSHSRWGRRRRPLFPHGSCPARGRNHGGTLCTTKPVRTELGFRTHRLYSSGE